jgi:hypothetical protein
MSAGRHDYRAEVFALGTMHGKARAIHPALQRHLGAGLRTTRALDTDRFGTFTGEIARSGTMLDAAREKAKAAIAEAGVPLGLGSEGSFGPHPALPFAACDRELLLLVDARSGREIHESLLSARTNFAHITCRPGDAIDVFLAQVRFPGHALVVAPNDPRGIVLPLKGIACAPGLQEAIGRMAAQSADGQARVATDMRADRNPTRMAVIRAVASRLGRRLARRCPGCGAAGFGTTEMKRGLPCAWCEEDVPVAVARLVRCDLCHFEIEEKLANVPAAADPRHCRHCNP